MNVTGVRVQFKKRVSDGNYGFEEVEAQYLADLDEGEDPNAAIRQLMAQGRAEVIGQLRESESSSIRWALEPPKQVEAPKRCAHIPGESCARCEGDEEEGEEDEGDDSFS